MHYQDYKKSSGAFIHGFRYLIRSFINIDTNNIVKHKFNCNEIVNKILNRINNSSGLYQMFGNLVDILIKNDDNDFIYIEELPLNYIKENLLFNYKQSIIISLNYGKNYGGVMNFTDNLKDSTYVFGKNRVTDIDCSNADKSNFLHPILYYYKLHMNQFSGY